MKNQVLLSLLLFLVSFYELSAQGKEDKSALDHIYQITSAQKDSLVLLYGAYSNRFDVTTDTAVRKTLEAKIWEIERAITINAEEELKGELQFVRTHLSSPLSLDILALKVYKQEAINYYPTFSSLFDKLSPSLRNSDKGKKIRETLAQIKNSQVGRMAPVFTVKDINGDLLSLSVLKDKKYVLLDFWASWCVPCRNDFPFLKHVYEKYSSKGLEIISVSIDAEREKWVAAIEKDGIGAWKHFSTKDNSSAVTSFYFVSAIPVKVLIDKEGKIIARWRGGSEENKEALDKILKSIFEKSF